MNQTDYFTEKIATLPEDIQEAILASDHEKTLKEIQREYKLHIDQAQILETLATQLIFGDIDAPDFVNNMFSEAHVSSAVAGDILLNIDTRILKKIRVYLEDLAEAKRRDAELEKLLMDDEQSFEDDKANAYAEYYAETANILEEEKQKLLEEGILPDGSNITDEMLAKETGISIDELRKKTQGGALRDASLKTSNNVDTEEDILTEKEELLHELESPEKSFSTPLFTPIQKQVSKTGNIEKITLPDHQLQNTHIEIPYVEEIVPTSPAPSIVEAKPLEAKPVTEKVSNPTQPVVKIPTKIVLSNDPYKETIE
jgi:hypothetical protein